MQAETKLLEPYYNFELEIPSKYIGRAMTDLERMYAKAFSPETYGENAVLVSAHIGSCRLLKALGIVIKPSDVIRIDLLEKTAYKGSINLTKYVDINELEKNLFSKSQILNIIWRLMNDKYDEHLRTRGIISEKSLKSWKEYNALKQCIKAIQK